MNKSVYKITIGIGNINIKDTYISSTYIIDT